MSVEKVKNVFEILAIFGAGSWALFNFVLKDTVTFNANIQSSAVLKSNEWSTENKYSVDYSIEIENAGSYPFYIDSIILYYWKIPDSELKGKVFIDYSLLEKKHNANDSF